MQYLHIDIYCRILYYFAKIYQKICGQGSKAIEGSVTKEVYKKLIDKLLNMKMKIEFEKTPQDDFSDLKTDMENIVKNANMNVKK